jgi:acetyl esterase/lipase
VPTQLLRALLALVDAKMRVDKQKFALTGHSLGGGLAVLLAASADLPVVAFNAPGVALTFVRDHAFLPPGLVIAPFYAVRALLAACEDRPRILNIRARFDAVSVGTGPQLGHVDTIHVAGCSYAMALRGPLLNCLTI